jgi:hypothetical protein
MEEAYQRAGEDEDSANPPWRGTIAHRLGIHWQLYRVADLARADAAF